MTEEEKNKLRDEFAKHAMIAIATWFPHPMAFDKFAEKAYKLADAMVEKAVEKREC